MPSNSLDVKQESTMDIDENEDDSDKCSEPPSFAAALGLHRVGTALPAKKTQPSQPIQVLNARGMPARIRKKNRLFFDDDIINDKPKLSPSKKTSSTSVALSKSPPTKSPGKMLKKRKSFALKLAAAKQAKQSVSKKVSRSSTPDLFDDEDYDNPDEDDDEDSTPAPSTIIAKRQPVKIEANRKVGQTLGLRLRNLLKLPKAHKWVSYEYFYSYIDRPLFLSENDFQTCLRESFPTLKTRMLTRNEWSRIRKLMGKPRRCSPAFFAEERRELCKRRHKIRLLQSRKPGPDIAANCKDLPNEIPLPLPVATKVTARLRVPQDGIFTGSIDAVDSLSSVYRITFDRPGLGTHSVPDYEVIATDYNETMPISSIVRDTRGKVVSNAAQKVAGISGALDIKTTGLNSLNKSDPLLGSEIFKSSGLKSVVYPKETIGGFQLKLLELIIRAKKTLNAKKTKLQRLKNMNNEAEMYKSAGEIYPEDYQRRYASIVIGTEKLNRDMQDYLNSIQEHARDLVKEPQAVAMLAPTYLREKCKELAIDSLQKNNTDESIQNSSMLRLITDLATIMWIASNLTNDDQSTYVLKVLEGYMEEAKSRLEPENVTAFLKNVQVHVRQIEVDLGSSAVSNLVFGR